MLQRAMRRLKLMTRTSETAFYTAQCINIVSAMQYPTAVSARFSLILPLQRKPSLASVSVIIYKILEKDLTAVI